MESREVLTNVAAHEQQLVWVWDLLSVFSVIAQELEVCWLQAAANGKWVTRLSVRFGL